MSCRYYFVVKLQFVLTVVFCVSALIFMNACQKSSVKRPALLGAGVALMPNPEFEKMKRLDKINKGELDPYMERWTEGLHKLTDKLYDKKVIGLQLPMFAAQLDALWDGEKFVASGLEVYVKRLNVVPVKTVRQWKEALNSVAGGSNEVEAAGFLIQIDRLFDGENFKQEEADILLKRLKAVTPEASDSYSKSIDGYRSQAAVMLAQGG
jgi:hypothetical protein